MKKLMLLAALCAMFPVNLFAVAWLYDTPLSPKEIAAAEKKASQENEKINALAQTMAEILDAKNQEPCGMFIEIMDEGIVCRTSREWSPVLIWTISINDLQKSPFAITSIGRKNFLVYKPFVDGAQDLGDLRTKGAIVYFSELEKANRKAILKQGKKAIEELRKSIEKKVSSNSLF